VLYISLAFGSGNIKQTGYMSPYYLSKAYITNNISDYLNVALLWTKMVRQLLQLCSFCDVLVTWILTFITQVTGVHITFTDYNNIIIFEFMQSVSYYWYLFGMYSNEHLFQRQILMCKLLQNSPFESSVKDYIKQICQEIHSRC
jgi:hypothetical protein